MTVAIILVFLISLFLQKFGIDPGAPKGGPPSHVIKNLIREVEEASGYTRTEARAKAKAWLVGNVTTLDVNEILLARTHFSYLLPADWGLHSTSATGHL